MEATSPLVASDIEFQQATGPFAVELVAGPASANTARVCYGYAPRTRSLRLLITSRDLQ
jgi:hypothetical protein